MKVVIKDTSITVNRYTREHSSSEEAVRQQKQLGRSALVSQFTQELTKVNGNVICTSPKELTRSIIELLKRWEVVGIHLEPNVLDEAALAEAGIHSSHTPNPLIRVGVTKAICGLADTGSILIVDGEGKPLQASLLPQIHIAILRTSDILPSLDNAMALPIVHESRAAVLITGPSRTADIEMSLTIGMHGPGELHVFLINETVSTLVHGTASTLVDD